MVQITLFDGFLGDVEISGNWLISSDFSLLFPTVKKNHTIFLFHTDALLKSITYEGHLSRPKNYLKLDYHCERFGLYAR